jgi:hypothetical protein
VGIVVFIQEICYRESVKDENGDETISRGCKPIEECPAGSMTDMIPSGDCEEDNGSETCLNCNYFENEPDDEEKPWHLCDKPGINGV